jgi:hypothetical protein
MAGMASHAGAALSAAPTDLGAAPHLLVVAELITASRAGLTDLCADAADLRVEDRLDAHEVDAGPAHLHAGEEQIEVLGRYVATALPQAVLYRLQTNAGALLAVSDAFLHLG